MLQTLSTKAFVLVVLGIPILVAQAQFGPEQLLLPGQVFPKLISIDLDGDGDLDLFGHFDDQSFKWSENTDGQGTLAGLSIIMTAGPVSTFAISDVDQNGTLDIIHVAADSTVQVAHGLGAGMFTPSTTIATLPSMAGRMRSADLTGDGFPELILSVSSGGSARIAVVPNNAGTFGPMGLLSPVIEGAPPTVLLVGEMDEIGGADIFFMNDANAGIGLLNVNGDGSEWQQMTFFNLFDYLFYDPKLIDVDGDGDLDIAEAGQTVIQWAENRLSEDIPFNAFTVRVIEPFMTAGIGDMADLGCGSGASLVYVPSNPGLPVRWSTYLISTARFAPRQDLLEVQRGQQLLLTDLNGDGKNDLLIGNENGLFMYANTTQPPTTVLELPLLDTVCVAGPSIALPDAVPSGGIWSGTWVDNNMFHRSSVGGTSTVPLAYTWYEPEGCPVGAIANIRVISGPTIDPFLGPVVCTGDGPYLMSSSPQATEWSGLSAGNILDLEQYNGEQIVAVYTDVTGTTCVSFMGPLNVWNSIPTAIVPVDTLCITDGVQTISAVQPWPNNYWSGDTTSTIGDDALFDPSIGAGVYTIYLDRDPTAPQQCANRDSITIVVSGDIPMIALTEPPAYCASTSSIDLAPFATPSGGEWSGPGVSGNVLLPFIAGPGTHYLTYSLSSAGGCSASEQTSITLASSVEITHDALGPLSFCIDQDPVIFTADPAGGEWNSPIQPDGTFEPAAAGTGAHELVYVYTDPNGCMLVNPPATITVHEEAVVPVIDPVATLCLADAPIQITGSPAGIWSGAVNGIGDTVLFDPQIVGIGIWPVSLTAEAEGFCPGTTTINVEVEICTGIASIEVHDPRISPNPTTGLAWIDLKADGSVELLVLDAAGRIVMRSPERAFSDQPIPIDLGSLANGTYHVQLIGKKQVFSFQVVKLDH